MANQAHLNLLVNGTADEWNKWREENPDIVPDLSCADLSNKDLSKRNFRDADFGVADLVDANLEDSDFRDADLEGADLTYAYIHGADFRGAKISGADFSEIEPEDMKDIKITESQAPYLLKQILGIEIFPDEEET